MTLRWYHWAIVAGAALWFFQSRRSLAPASGNAEAASENVAGQSQASGFSSILGNLVNALISPPASAAPSSTPTAATTAAATVAAPSPVAVSPPSYTSPASGFDLVPNTAA